MIKSDEEWNSILQNTQGNKALVEGSTLCGCISCWRLFDPRAVAISRYRPRRGSPQASACCPFCGSRTVLPESSAYRLTPALLIDLGKWALGPDCAGEQWLRTLHHRYASHNEDWVRNSSVSACFYCYAFFPSEQVDEWWDRFGRMTAVCPCCGIDSVLPEAPGILLDETLVRTMGHWAFNGYARGDDRLREAGLL